MSPGPVSVLHLLSILPAREAEGRAEGGGLGQMKAGAQHNPCHTLPCWLSTGGLGSVGEQAFNGTPGQSSF